MSKQTICAIIQRSRIFKLLFLVVLVVFLLIFHRFICLDPDGNSIQATGMNSINYATTISHISRDGYSLLFIAPNQPMGHAMLSSIAPYVVYGAVTVPVHDEIAVVLFSLDNKRKMFFPESSGGGDVYTGSFCLEKGLNIYILYNDWESSKLLIPFCDYFGYMDGSELDLGKIDTYIKKSLSPKEVAMYENLKDTNRSYRISKLSDRSSPPPTATASPPPTNPMTPGGSSP